MVAIVRLSEIPFGSPLPLLPLSSSSWLRAIGGGMGSETRASGCGRHLGGAWRGRLDTIDRGFEAVRHQVPGESDWTRDVHSRSWLSLTDADGRWGGEVKERGREGARDIAVGEIAPSCSAIRLVEHGMF